MQDLANIYQFPLSSTIIYFILAKEHIKMKPFAAEPADLLRLIRENAEHAEKVIRADLAQATQDGDPLLQEILEYALLGGGKRLRYFLTVICAQLCAGKDKQNLSLLAAAFEYLHTATLIHDDVIDHAANRRGKASVVRRYGMTAAILSGDWLHARSMHLIGSLAGPAALDIFCTTTAEIVDGEFLQMRHVEDLNVLEHQYFAIIARKTAGLIRAACAIGALYGQGNAEQIHAVSVYGEKIGLAFQLVDDLLDYIGNEQTTGKKTGNDFLEGKITLPLIHALNHATIQDKESFLRCFKGDRSQAQHFIAVQKLLEKSGSFVYCRQQAATEIDQALSALSCFTHEQEQQHRILLQQLAGYVLRRDR
jgi:octaprenyl-diphosphate synthase